MSEHGAIQMQFNELKQMKNQSVVKREIQEKVKSAITLLYYFLERQINHAAGNLILALEISMQYQELLNFDNKLLY